MSAIGIIGLLLAIAILIFGAYKGLGALPLTLIAALVAIVFNGIPLWEGFATHYMAGYTSAYMSYFLMFACSALYAKLMDESGCATAIGYKFIDWFGRKNVMLVCILIVSVLTYGGVSLFVVVYAVAPHHVSAVQRGESAPSPDHGLPDCGCGHLHHDHPARHTAAHQCGAHRISGNHHDRGSGAQHHLHCGPFCLVPALLHLGQEQGGVQRRGLVLS